MDFRHYFKRTVTINGITVLIISQRGEKLLGQIIAEGKALSTCIIINKEEVDNAIEDTTTTL